MSLRIMIKPEQIAHWITQRNGTPARRCGSETDFRILFDPVPAGCETLTMNDFLTDLSLSHKVLLVDEEPGKTYHQFVARD